MPMTLKQWIEAKKLTQRKAAKCLGVDAPTLSRWLSGNFKPNLQRAYRIEKATKGAVPMWTWVARKPPAPPLASAVLPPVLTPAIAAFIADAEKLTPASDS